MRRLCLLFSVTSFSLYPASTLLLRVGLQQGLPISGIAAISRIQPDYMQRRLKSTKKTGTHPVPVELVPSRKVVLPTVAKFIETLHKESAKLDQSFLATLRYKEFSDKELDAMMPNAQDSESSSDWMRQQRAQWHAYEKYRVLALADLFGRDKVCVTQAVEMQDHEVLAHILQCGADPNAYDDSNGYSPRPVFLAMQNDDLTTLKLLMDAGASVYEITNISGMSVEMFKHLLDQGVRERDPWHHPSYIRDLACAIEPESDVATSRDFMLKVMLAVNSGASANPYVGRGGCLLDSYFGCDVKELFPDFIEYLSAECTLALDVCNTKKKAAEVKIRKIMKKYNITEDAVTVASEIEASSSRVQEAD